jgi:hypothetical protein
MSDPASQSSSSNPPSAPTNSDPAHEQNKSILAEAITTEVKRVFAEEASEAMTEEEKEALDAYVAHMLEALAKPGASGDLEEDFEEKFFMEYVKKKKAEGKGKDTEMDGEAAGEGAEG